MSLLSVDITKVKRLSLRGIKPLAPQRREEPITPTVIHQPPTVEETVYSILVSKHPLLEELVETLDLVSPTTGERIKKVAPSPQPLLLENPKLEALALSLFKPETSYTPEQVVQRILEAKGVSRARAMEGFNLLVDTGALQITPASTYYLRDSTPF